MYFRILLLMTALIASGGESLAGRRVALVIGNANYTQTTPLINTVNDAADFIGALSEFGFEVVPGLNLKLTETQDAVRRFAERLKGAEVGLFFYSGHGLQVGGVNYIVPVDAALRSEADLDFNLMKVDLILKQMERETKTNIVILDACRNNPLTRNLALNMGTRSASLREGLAPIQAGIGTFIAYATQPGNVALDGTGGARNSPFTAALMSNIRRPNAEIGPLMRMVRRSVIEATAGEQVPWDSSSLTGEFYFASGIPGGPATASATTAPAVPIPPPAPADPAAPLVKPVPSNVPNPVSPAPTPTAALPQPPAIPFAGRTLWNHNGSVVSLAVSGNERRFYYQVPRQAMAEQGVKTNTLLFSGTLSGSNYRGTAYLFSRKCGSRPYTVEGPIVDDGRRVVLRGQATRIDANCQVIGTIVDEIVFEYLRRE